MVVIEKSVMKKDYHQLIKQMDKGRLAKNLQSII